MDLKLIEAREHIVKAREALRRGDKNTARHLGEKAVLLTPNLEDAWLILVAADSSPEDALAYAKKALELNPQSPRAHKALEWAAGQLREANVAASPRPAVDKVPTRPKPGAGNMRVMAQTVPAVLPEASIFRPKKVEETKTKGPATNPGQWMLIFAGAFLGLVICAGIIVATWSVFRNPSFASFLPASDLVPTQEVLWAAVNIPKPGVEPMDVSAFAPQPTSVVATPLATEELPGIAPTEPPEAIATEAPAAKPEATEPPGVMAMDILADTPTSEYVAPAPPLVASGNGKGGARWIDVNLSTQSVYAYEGDTVVNSFVVSTGTWMTPTVTGKYKIWIKFKSTSMSGPGYFLPNVPYVMYFYKGYGLHGTYWHNNFGTPMSHGCVNLRTSDAEWLYNWASVGTVVNVHY